MARPSKFNPERGQVIVKVLAECGGRDCAAMVAGIGLRTLTEWLVRGRAGDPAFAEWARQAEEAEELARRRRAASRKARECAASRARYQRYKAARAPWWRDHLGEEEFWRRRLEWLRDRNMTRAFAATVARLAADGFRVE
jgi:hypothetical protein